MNKRHLDAFILYGILIISAYYGLTEIPKYYACTTFGPTINPTTLLQVGIYTIIIFSVSYAIGYLARIIDKDETEKKQQ